MCRGDVPKPELLKSLSWWEKPIGRLMIGKLEGKYNLEEGYNLEAAKGVKRGTFPRRKAVRRSQSI